ncbi:hypothetical protein MWU54_14990 [Marivita sp. S6314]|uniref:hypothetical protein n=1 Tax=Marivita sp. S6314 TaxID=2926406 RepID=UPI001FF35710|nr:hypothetical protein [Marivita sp. S6314]MCK0151346.1 hypothetical protein [Marivita sp. S6314]
MTIAYQYKMGSRVTYSATQAFAKTDWWQRCVTKIGKREKFVTFLLIESLTLHIPTMRSINSRRIRIGRFDL